MQRDLLAPGGFGGMLSNDVLQLHRTREPMAMHTRERPRPDLADLPRAKRIRGRRATHAILHKRNITELVVTGVTTEVCVNTTTREANDRGCDCLVPEDCAGSYLPEFRDAGLKMITEQGGIFGWVSQSCDVFAALNAA